MSEKPKRTALVTGGVQGLGAAAARALQNGGFAVAATHLGGRETARAFGNETGIPVFEWDVSDFDACLQDVAEVEKKLGRVDVLVNNAGVNRDVMLHKMSREEWDAVLRADLDSMFNMCRPVTCGMRERGFGRIINVSSVNVQEGQAGQTNYCAAKAGIQGFTWALSRESAHMGVTVNAIAPGYADTAMVEAVPDEIMTTILKQVPLGRLADLEEIGRAVAFLASEGAGFIIGATLPVNGGLYMG